MTGMTPHTLGLLHSLHMAQVVDNADPESRGRIQVQLQATDVRVWASVVSSSAGDGYGTSFIPRIDEIVVLAFVAPDLPLVLGSIWSGQNSIPENADPHEDHYVVRTPAGTVMEFDDNDGPKLEIQTRQGHKLTISDGNGGEIEIMRGAQSMKMTAAAITIKSGGQINIESGGPVNVTAPIVSVSAAMSTFSGTVKADTVISNSVISASYTPGAGNIW